MGRPNAHQLRQTPTNIRYTYIAVSTTMVHTGLTYGGLIYARKNHTIRKLMITDLKRMEVIEVTEPIEKFMERWSEHYLDVNWDYIAEIGGKAHGECKGNG